VPSCPARFDYGLPARETAQLSSNIRYRKIWPPEIVKTIANADLIASVTVRIRGLPDCES
jgi:hypothetical protein